MTKMVILLPTTLILITRDDDGIDTPDGHEEEDQDDDDVVTISKSELDRLKKQNEKLKSNKIKNIVQTQDTR